MAVRHFKIEEFDHFYCEEGGPKMGFDLKFQDVGLILQNSMFSLVCFLGIILPWVHKQGDKARDIYLECVA